MLNQKTKQEIIQEYGKAEGDTGGTEVQIALMQARILQITEHLKANRKDAHSRRGLLVLVGKRRRLEKYLKMNDILRYRQLIKQLGIREVKAR